MSAGVHTLESAEWDKGINVIVVGYQPLASYAYLGGMGLQSINPIVV